MAIGWLTTVLKIVPWTEVISNAPKVADGARKLMRSVAGQPAVVPAQPAAAPAEPVESPQALALAGLQERAATLEAAVADLHGQMLASSELIKALAEQNTQLIVRVEALRRRLLWLALAGAVLALGAGLALYLH